MKKIPDLPPPQPASVLGDTPTLEQLVQELKTLRLYAGNLFLALRDMRDYCQENFHNTYNRLDGHDSAIASIDETFDILTGE